jgi:hypothetical protein
MNLNPYLFNGPVRGNQFPMGATRVEISTSGGTAIPASPDPQWSYFRNVEVRLCT